MKKWYRQLEEPGLSGADNLQRFMQGLAKGELI